MSSVERGSVGGEREGLGFSGFLCQEIIWIGGQVDIQFQIGSGHVGVASGSL
jgi:hypothetical protein